MGQRAALLVALSLHRIISLAPVASWPYTSKLSPYSPIMLPPPTPHPDQKFCFNRITLFLFDARPYLYVWIGGEALFASTTKKLYIFIRIGNFKYKRRIWRVLIQNRIWYCHSAKEEVKHAGRMIDASFEITCSHNVSSICPVHLKIDGHMRRDTTNCSLFLRQRELPAV